MLAVNCPGQAPSVGAQARSISARSASLIFPARTAPTPSYVSIALTSRPCHSPGSIAPPYMKTLGTLSRTIAIIIAGSVLSQPASPTSAS